MQTIKEKKMQPKSKVKEHKENKKCRTYHISFYWLQRPSNDFASHLKICGFYQIAIFTWCLSLKKTFEPNKICNRYLLICKNQNKIYPDSFHKLSSCYNLPTTKKKAKQRILNKPKARFHGTLQSSYLYSMNSRLTVPL